MKENVVKDNVLNAFVLVCGHCGRQNEFPSALADIARDGWLHCSSVGDCHGALFFVRLRVPGTKREPAP